MEDVEKILKGFKENNIPLDTFWLDIDYMDNKFIFTCDEKNFKAQDLNELKSKYKYFPK